MYDNILIGTKGATRTVYAIKPNGTCEYLSRGDVTPLPGATNFILVDSRLHHIPSQTSSQHITQARSIEPLGENTFNITSKEDKVIEWTGSRFTVVEQHDPSTQPMETDEYAGRTLERPTTDLRETAKFDLLVDKIQRVHPYVETRSEAKDFLNGEFESPVPSEDIRASLQEDLEKDEMRMLTDRGLFS